jgi:6-phosphogluconolactonase
MTINPKNKIEVFETPDDLSVAMAEFIIKLAKEAIAASGRFSISLSGGSTPEKLFKLMAGAGYKDRMPWKDTFVFWGDERCVPLTDDRNNAHVAKILLLDKVGIPASHVFPIPVNINPPSAAAMVYEKTLKDFFHGGLPQFDLILLGIGENAHTASLFPHTSVIHEQKEWVSAVYVDEVKMYRITMTAPFINNARNVVFIAVGDNKAEVVKTVLTSPFEPEKFPAQLISPVNGSLFWYLDKKATALITH